MHAWQVVTVVWCGSLATGSQVFFVTGEVRVLTGFLVLDNSEKASIVHSKETCSGLVFDLSS